MKERITFIHASDDAYDPGQLAVNESSLRIKNLRADREHRLTFNLQEIPQEVFHIPGFNINLFMLTRENRYGEMRCARVTNYIYDGQAVEISSHGFLLCRDCLRASIFSIHH